MRIGIFDPYLDDLGGGEKYMMTIAECLSQKHRVDVFWDNNEDFKALAQRFSLDMSRVNLVPNIFSPNIATIKRLLGTKKYDVVIVLSDGSIPFVLSKKLFLHLQQPLENFNPQSLKGKIKLSRVNGIFCNSQYTELFNQKRFKIKSLVIYPPVSFLKKNVRKENIILTVGRFRVRDVITGLDDYKKFPVLIEVFKKMVTAGLKDWKLLIATSIKDEDKPVFEEFRKSVKGFPIEFLVNKTNDELWDVYSRAKIYWHASGFGEDLGKHPEYAEHFGMSTVEAMGAGAVPVVIGAGGQKEIVREEENGFLWNTLEELESKTVELINNTLLLNKLAKNAEKSSRRFNKEKFCQEINDMVLR